MVKSGQQEHKAQEFEPFLPFVKVYKFHYLTSDKRVIV